jgi:hypothetical protein
MVGLIIGSLIVGGVMGLLSASLNYAARLNARSAAQPILEAAAQQVLAMPELALSGQVPVGEGAEASVVEIATLKVENPEAQPLGMREGELYQVQLRYLGQILEFSIIIPKPEEL